MRKRIKLRFEKTLRRLEELRRRRPGAAVKSEAEAWRHMLQRLDSSEAERRLRQAELALNQLR